MTVALPPDLEAFVKEKVDTGRYASVSDVIREALYLLQDRDRVRAAKLQVLREEIRKGLESGNPVDGEQVLAKMRKRLADTHNQ